MEYPSQFCLHQLFEQHAERTPDAVACVFEEQQLSYGELNRRANQLAHYLKKRGVGPGQRVGIFVERSLDMMVGLLGIQKSGAAYVPLDPYYPAERIRMILDDAQVPILLTQQALLETIACALGGRDLSGFRLAAKSGRRTTPTWLVTPSLKTWCM